jgi:cobalt/nickel transport system permease protein
VLVDEAERLLRARESRAAALPGRRAGGSIAWRAGVLGSMVGTLFLRAYERSERIHAAMLSRGYSGEWRSLPARPLSAGERGLLVTGAALLAAIVWLAHWR